MALTPMAVEGSIYVMLAHGIATGGLFLAVGIIYERRHTRLISEFGGLTKVVPVFSTFFMIIVFTSAGLPGLAGFVGEFLVIVGTGESEVLYFEEASLLVGGNLGPETTAFIFATVAATGVIFGAVYLLWMFQRVMFGPLKNPKNEHMKDLSGREVAYFIPIIAVAFLMGIFPETLFMNKMHTSVDAFMDLMRPGISKKVSDDFTKEKNEAATLDFDKAARKNEVKLTRKLDKSDDAAERKAAAKARENAARKKNADPRPKTKLSDGVGRPVLKRGTTLNIKPEYVKVVQKGTATVKEVRAKKAKEAKAKEEKP
jgi:hypothetical protein